LLAAQKDHYQDSQALKEEDDETNETPTIENGDNSNEKEIAEKSELVFSESEELKSAERSQPGL
jgi:hypothetical protein